MEEADVSNPFAGAEPCEDAAGCPACVSLGKADDLDERMPIEPSTADRATWLPIDEGPEAVSISCSSRTPRSKTARRRRRSSSNSSTATAIRVRNSVRFGSKAARTRTKSRFRRRALRRERCCRRSRIRAASCRRSVTSKSTSVRTR
ncbi:hypothetical protein D8S78_00295 [Natrialba swarupiae]|nr:hypothetical protein [Natrialba swarupiae]